MPPPQLLVLHQLLPEQPAHQAQILQTLALLRNQTRRLRQRRRRQQAVVCQRLLKVLLPLLLGV